LHDKKTKREVSGNDMQSIMGGTYPGPGIAFAYIAASDAAKRMGVE
jgi:hypothetical protein